ncbi:MAG: hypothetical protein QOE90_1555 [Thermoplasmata archaeon]|jgi:uncharacterized membrane protein|nr:hypothetical protein [Thermoplasmata archaeon]
MDTLTWVVRYIHILSAVAWVGAAMLFSMMIAPRVLRDGPPQIRRPFLEAVLAPLTRWFAISTPLTILSGLVLVGQIWGWSNYGAAFQTGKYGVGLSIGFVAAIVSAVLGFAVVARSGEKLLKKMQSINGPPTAEQQAELAALGKRVGMGSMAAVLFGMIALGGMVWAVNAVR